MLWFGSQRQLKRYGRIPRNDFYFGEWPNWDSISCVWSCTAVLWDKWRRQTLLHGFLAISPRQRI